MRAGDPDAFGQLYDEWFDRVHDLAFRIVFDTEVAAEVAQDAFLSAWRNLDSLADPYAFGGWLLRIARNGALNRKRKEQRSRPVDETRLAVIEGTQTRPEDRLRNIDDPEQVAEDREVVALLWDAAGALGDRDREVLDLQLRHGLTPNEIAEVVGINRNAANQLVHRVRQRLGTAVGAHVLWRAGEPSCDALRAELLASRVETFDSAVVRIVDRHAQTCAECNTRRDSHLSPAALFAAVPIISLPALKAKVAAALATDGVPMQGSMAGVAGAEKPAGHAWRGRWRRIAIGGAAAAAIVVGATWIGATTLDDNTAEFASETIPDDASSPTTTASPTTTVTPTTAAPLPTSPVGPAPSGTAPVIVAPPTAPPTVGTTTAPPAPTPAFTITPAQVAWTPSGYPRPIAQWNVTGAAAVTVTGPGFTATSPRGNVPICPGATNAAGFCAAPRGVYTYALQAKDAGGKVVGQRLATLTIS
jgi:RNA polymerase sigma factor (sigma-70 family)